MARVHIFGSLNIDLVAYVDQLPKPGETRHGKRFLTAAGGKGLNQAIAAARGGAAVSVIGSVGDDERGRWLTETAQNEGINISSILKHVDLPTGVALIEVDDQGENSIIIVAGANFDADPTMLRVESGDIVLAQLETSIASVLTCFKIAKAAGATTILNPSPATSLSPELLTLTDILIPNEHEASRITGLATATMDEAISAASALRDGGVGTCIITLGARGAILVNADGVTVQPPFPVIPIDTTGAGDAFCGAFAAALSLDRKQAEALAFAAAAGALSTTIAGAVPSLPNRAGILYLMTSPTTC
jgi:ribokinase